MKALFIISVLLFSACSENETLPISTGTTGGTVVDTFTLQKQIFIQHDTLVIIQTYDSIKRDPDWGKDSTRAYISDGGYEMRPINLFENGKTKDTIRRHEHIYY